VKVQLEILGNGRLIATTADGEKISAVVSNVSMKHFEQSEELQFTIETDEERWNVKTVLIDDQMLLWGSEQAEWTRPIPGDMARQGSISTGTSVSEARAPMPGLVERVLVKAGDVVKTGQALVVLVAMKMEYIIRAPRETTVIDVPCNAGKSVQKNAVLVRFGKEEDGN